MRISIEPSHARNEWKMGSLAAYPPPFQANIFINKIVISVCLFVCPIITQEPLDRFA